MKGFFGFITGEFFNYIGAIFRLPFSKKKYTVLPEETRHNNIVFGHIKYNIRSSANG
jgi:hypothetical protein